MSVLIRPTGIGDTTTTRAKACLDSFNQRTCETLPSACLAESRIAARGDLLVLLLLLVPVLDAVNEIPRPGCISPQLTAHCLARVGMIFG
mmetsp:Transcript_9489/g.24609  ORF Transcript_9489/g.24609 Transcript_9489/m.24609 type:complete len:90 (-) Transcript_9489:410-679(-)